MNEQMNEAGQTMRFFVHAGRLSSSAKSNQGSLILKLGCGLVLNMYVKVKAVQLVR